MYATHSYAITDFSGVCTLIFIIAYYIMFISQNNIYINTHLIQEPLFAFIELRKILREVNKKARAAAIAVQIPVVWVHVTLGLDPQASMDGLMNRR